MYKMYCLINFTAFLLCSSSIFFYSIHKWFDGGYRTHCRRNCCNWHARNEFVGAPPHIKKLSFVFIWSCCFCGCFFVRRITWCFVCESEQVRSRTWNVFRCRTIPQELFLFVFTGNIIKRFLLFFSSDSYMFAILFVHSIGCDGWKNQPKTVPNKIRKHIIAVHDFFFIFTWRNETFFFFFYRSLSFSVIRCFSHQSKKEATKKIDPFGLCTWKKTFLFVYLFISFLFFDVVAFFCFDRKNFFREILFLGCSALFMIYFLFIKTFINALQPLRTIYMCMALFIVR